MSNIGFELQEIRGKDRMQFSCRGCADCCRHVKENIMLESLDAYRIAIYLNENGKGVYRVEDVFYQYAHPVDIAKGYPIYTVKTTGEKAECIFLNGNACSIYQARPRVCRLYPFSVGPGSRGKDFHFYLCKDKEHHFGQGHILVKEWMYQNFKQEDRELVKREFAAAKEIGQAIRKLGIREREKDLFLLLYYRYFNFDLQKPFFEQYDRNHKILMRELHTLEAAAERI